MSKIKVYEMARKVGMSNKDFLMKLQEWGIELKSHLNVIEDSDMKIIEGKLKQIGDKKGEMKNLNTNKDTKKIEKKKDEPRIIRREIVQVKDEAIEEDKKVNSDFDYDLKPKKVANPEQFRRSDAQIEKKNAHGSTLKTLTKEDFSKFDIPILPIEIQNAIVTVLDRFEKYANDLSCGLPAEIEKRKQQYEYYRDLLLKFEDISEVQTAI